MRAIAPQFWVYLALLACESTPDRTAPMTNPAGASSSGAELAPASPPFLPAPPAESKTAAEEPSSRTFWVNPDSEAARAALRLQPTQPREAGWLRQLAEQPTAVWFTPAETNPLAAAQRLAQSVAGTDRYAVAVIAALPKKDCARFSTPGLAPQAYRSWLESLVQGLGETPTYWILEPEALLLTGCLTADEVKERMSLLAESILVLKKNPKAQVYMDVGFPGWLSVDEAVQRLLTAGVLAGDGFAINVGQYHWTEDCIRYGQEISQRLGGKSFVIDTSRNGKGPVSREAWCNPKSRAIGQTPQAPTGIKGLDAYLWLKKPGDSDGSCNGGPAAGQWWEAKAIELMRNAVYPD
ncbi:MAG TPA: glycoside hydrolase family 6 protein [Oligoflexus sp.]|uniref:glycoside hydrolase family 6 protein n=1 Tax=Oligoflexus sp. TaxID=1971216 RepID=UPI002D34C53E|nr:glycoside hydrolase family 6 protein [Oligoflexus sp.]HYX37804.1 glycoside hydrolase family 6 protein [Oligoflexus sp.]